MNEIEHMDFLRGILWMIKIYSSEDEISDRIIGRIQERIERQLNVVQKTVVE